MVKSLTNDADLLLQEFEETFIPLPAIVAATGILPTTCRAWNDRKHITMNKTSPRGRGSKTFYSISGVLAIMAVSAMTELGVNPSRSNSEIIINTTISYLKVLAANHKHTDAKQNGPCYLVITPQRCILSAGKPPPMPQNNSVASIVFDCRKLAENLIKSWRMFQCHKNF